MNVSGECRLESDLADVRFFVQDRLAKMSNTPPLRDVVIKELCEHVGCFPCYCIAPGTERNKEIVLLVERHISVHHTAYAYSTKLFDRHAEALFNVLFEIAVAGSEALVDLIERVCPDTVLKVIFPGVTARSNDAEITADEHCLNSGRAEFYTEYRTSVFNLFFCVDSHVPCPFLWFRIMLLFPHLRFII